MYCVSDFRSRLLLDTPILKQNQENAEINFQLQEFKNPCVPSTLSLSLGIYIYIRMYMCVTYECNLIFGTTALIETKSRNKEKLEKN